MKIGLSCSTIDPFITQGRLDGIGYYMQYLLEELTRLGHTLTPYCFPPLKKWNYHSSLSNSLTAPLPYMAATTLSLSASIFLHTALQKKISLFHATDHWIPRLKKIPVIATLHDALILKKPEWYGGRFRYLKNLMRKKTIAWADHFITISESMVGEIVEYWGIPLEKISVIYNGIDPWWLESVSFEKKHALRETLQIPENFLLCTGTLQPKKNIPRLIYAYLNLPRDVQENYPLVIVGKLGWNTEEILGAIQTLQQKKAGIWLNYLTREQLRAVYQTASLYVYPSLHEGFGLTLLEAFASQTPVLTSNVSALPETAGDAAYFVDPLSIDDITQGIFTLLTEKNRCEDLIKKGNERVKNFSWEKCARETVKVYEGVANRD